MIEDITNKNKKLINNSIWFFIILSCCTILLSFIGNIMGWETTYSSINPITLDSTNQVVSISNLLSGEGIRYMIGNFVSNFVTFAPLGMLLVCLVGIGVAYKSGFLPTVFGLIGKKINKFWLTFIIVILSIISSFSGENWYVLLIPLAAIFFLANNRNPLVGIVASFVSITAGHSINFLLSSLDYNLMPYTQLASKLIDKDYNMSQYGNIIFSSISTIALAFLITYVTEKIVLSKIPKYKRDELILEEVNVARKEKRGLILARLGIIILTVIFVYTIIPGLPFSGVLLDDSGKTYLAKLYGANSYFEQGLMFFITIALFFGGILYGIGAKAIKSVEHVSSLLYQSMNNIGSILVLIFFASQFIALFKWTNIGTLITSLFTNMIMAVNITSFPLILLLFIVVGIANLFLTSPVAKWAIISPIIVPLCMKANITPEFTQAIYRVSYSATNIITPLMASFVVFIGYLEFYNQSDKSVSIGDTYKILWPYVIAITILWLFIILSWYIIGLPIGINAYPTI